MTGGNSAIRIDAAVSVFGTPSGLLRVAAKQLAVSELKRVRGRCTSNPTLRELNRSDRITCVVDAGQMFAHHWMLQTCSRSTASDSVAVIPPDLSDEGRRRISR